MVVVIIKTRKTRQMVVTSYASRKNPSRSYVERQGPRGNDFKRFKDGIEGTVPTLVGNFICSDKRSPKTEGQFIITEKAVHVCNEFWEVEN